MKKSRKGKSFVKQAYYKGGSKALEEFVKSNLRYPQIAFDNNIEGTVHARYDINNRGKVIKIKLYNSLGYGCDEEAKRVIRLLQFEVPKTRGLRLIFHKEIHIHFRKPKSVQQPTVHHKPTDNLNTDSLYTMNLQYKIVATQKEENNKTDNSNNGYNYTISI